MSQSKNIIIICDDYVPSSKKAAARMIHELAIHLVLLGHHTTVIAPTILDEKIVDCIDGVHIIRFKPGAIKNVSRIKRFFNELILSKKVLGSFCLYYHRKPDLVIYYSPSIFFGEAISKIKKLYQQAKSYLILRDFFPQWAIDNGLIKKNSLIAKFLRFYEAKNYQASDKIGVMSPANLDWFNHYTQSRYADKIEVLYNWGRFEGNIEANSAFRKEHHLENKVVLIYGGNIGHAQCMKNVIVLARNLQAYKEAHIAIIGQGDEYFLIQDQIKIFNLSNITLLPSLSQKDYFAIQKTADIGLFSLHKDHKTHNFPGKVLGYLSQGLPVLGCVNPGNDLKEIINENEAGFIVESGEDLAFKKHALKLIENQKLRSRMANNAKRLLKEIFSVERTANKILSVLEN